MIQIFFLTLPPLLIMNTEHSKFSQNFQVRYGEVNQSGQLMIHHLFNYMQEIAFNHADALANTIEGKSHFDFAVVWTRMKLEVEKIPNWKENLTISTWISPLKDQQRFAFRNFAIFNQSGQKIGKGYGSLLFFDLKQRKAMGVPKEVENYPTHEEPGDSHHFSQIDINVSEKKDTSFSTNFQDLDIYRHVNNVKYIEWAFNEVKPEIYKLYIPSSVEINFLKELRLGESFCVQTEYLEGSSELVIKHLIYKEESGVKIAQLQTSWKKK
ncbi:hypothetical protein WKT22_01140 [Candidatus Lokiarchaeum ossiferum]